VVAAEESCLFDWQRKVAELEGMFVCPETATCVAALETLVETGEITRGDEVVIFNTAAGQKYMEHIELDVPQIDLGAFPWDTFENRFGRTAFAVR
jgi:threonine synthase